MITSHPSLQISKMQHSQSGVQAAIQQASAKTGVDFDYLVKQANVESSMNPNAHAKTSSASGLYQFIDQTWLQMMKSHGAEHGYGKLADSIKQTNDGDYYVSNKATRNTILNMRKDPKASSLMAAELATENNSYLSNATGKTPSGTDLYLAHFMGAQGASDFINSMKKNPWAPAASMFPDAARSNKGVFYAQGRPLSLQQIYNNFDAKFQGQDASPVQTAVASNSVSGNSSNDFENRVILPLANDWSNPASPDYQQKVAMVTQSANSRMVSAFTSTNPNTEQTASGFGQRVPQKVQWPMDTVLEMQANSGRFSHNNQGRYNA